MDQFKEIILETIKEMESNNENVPVMFKWTYPEAPEWEVALGFRRKEPDGNNI